MMCSKQPDSNCEHRMKLLLDGMNYASYRKYMMNTAPQVPLNLISQFLER